MRLAVLLDARSGQVVYVRSLSSSTLFGRPWWLTINPFDWLEFLSQGFIFCLCSALLHPQVGTAQSRQMRSSFV
jgi:hypothetical protein